MISLIISEDAKSSQELIDKLTSGIEQMNIKNFSEPLILGEITNEILTQSFFSEKKAIVIKGILQTKNKDLIDSLSNVLEKIPADCHIIFIEDSKPDTRKSIYKKISTLGKVHTISLLTPNEAPKWIQEKVKSKNGTISFGAAQKLAHLSGSDLHKLNNELDKLLAYSPTVTEENINKLIKDESQESIFQLMDAISNKNSKQAMTLLEKFLQEGENEAYLLSMIARQIRNLLIVSELSRKLSEAELAKAAGLHPFVVKKTLSQSRKFTTSELLYIHNQILKIDEEIKDSSIDPRVAVTKLVCKFSK